MNYNEFFNLLAHEDSRKSKIRLLNVHKDNEILKEIVRLSLNPSINFFIKNIPSYSVIENKPFSNLSWAFAELEKISSQSITDNEAIEHLQYILSSLKFDDSEIIVKLIKKDLKCGISIKMINEVWPNLISEQSCWDD